MGKRKLKGPVTLFVAINMSDYEFLRELAFRGHCSIADVAREAIADLRKKRSGKNK